MESGYGVSSTQSFWKVISPPRRLGLKDKKAIDLGVLDFHIPCIACANLISMPKALSESRRRAMFICWQLSGAELCCMIPLEIAKYLTGLNSLIFFLLFFSYRHPVVKVVLSPWGCPEGEGYLLRFKSKAAFYRLKA